VTVRDARGRPVISFAPAAIAFGRGATFVAALGRLSPPLPSGPAYVRVAQDSVINRVTLMTVGGTGSCLVDIWVDTYANFPPSNADSICASSFPQIISGTRYEDTALVGWSRALAAGSIIAFNLTSSSVFNKVVVELGMETL